MKDLIKAHLEPTVEENLQRIYKELKKSNRKGWKVGAWVFNDKYGTHVFETNDPVPTGEDLSIEERSHYHAERLCISSLPNEFKENGTNTLFVTLIPCEHCVEFLKQQDFKIRVMYFVDPLERMKNPKYLSVLKEFPMSQYFNKDKEPKDTRINDLIGEISKLTHWYVK